MPDLDSILETLEILGDPELVAALRESIREADAGETVSWDDVACEFLP